MTLHDERGSSGGPWWFQTVLLLVAGGLVYAVGYDMMSIGWAVAAWFGAGLALVAGCWAYYLASQWAARRQPMPLGSDERRAP